MTSLLHECLGGILLPSTECLVLVNRSHWCDVWFTNHGSALFSNWSKMAAFLYILNTDHWNVFDDASNVGTKHNFTEQNSYILILSAMPAMGFIKYWFRDSKYKKCVMLWWGYKFRTWEMQSFKNKHIKVFITLGKSRNSITCVKSFYWKIQKGQDLFLF